ncbi:glycosyltransferase family 2 protein [Pseudoduganella sp. SL102]|uniref:glycosyltransferase family 2 protein n=1 Tax=Pseudoduganella sp. SL102 TaxID=2995154 RepID=UPI00248B9A09|nr:glycosyltransferase family 2 protein [Pseudoduganella sp. SL102]WBS01801.1 glycosyltransferase family 2 protein [Pseudoduganella sp. SL102]
MNADFLSPEQIPAVSGNERWHGAIEGLHERLLFGWAFDRERPDSRVVVEICLDGMPCAFAAADAARPDLADMLGVPDGHVDVCHGFVADLGELPSGARGVLTARIANTDAVLAGALPLDNTRSAPVTALSSVVYDGGLRLSGWAIDPADPRRAVTVRALDGHNVVAQAVADIVLPSMRGHVEGPHGFELALPLSLADGKTREIRVVNDSGQALNGSPAFVCCVPGGMAALLPAGSDKLMLEVATMYERLVPRSVPLRAWPEWSTHFDGATAGLDPRPPVSLKAAILITGTADEGVIARTAASLQGQGVIVQAFSSQPFSALLASAMAAGCDVIGCVRAGDTLPAQAIVHALEGFALGDAQLVYTDSEQDSRPWFKPAWNADYALATDYPLELLLVRGALLSHLEPPNDPAEFAWSALAAAGALGELAIVHVPRVLYRMNSPLTDEERGQRARAAERAARMLEPGLQLKPLDRVPAGLAHAARRVQASLPAGWHDLTVSLVIPTRDRADLLKRCIDSIRRFTAWPKLDIVVIDNGSAEAATLALFAELAAEGVRILPMPGPFNYADLNNRAVALARGDIVGLINNDIEALHDGWLDEIVAQLCRPGIGAVGAKLLWPNGMVQHGGVLLGIGNVAGHFGNLLADGDWGDHGRNQLPLRVSACTAACLFLRRQDYLDVGGMDAQAFPVAFNDVDLCLKLRAKGKAIVWTPFAKLLHAESASRGHEDTPQKKARAQREVNEFRRRWGHVIVRDPAYHPALNLDANSHAFGGLAIPPRQRLPRTGSL